MRGPASERPYTTNFRRANVAAAYKPSLVEKASEAGVLEPRNRRAIGVMYCGVPRKVQPFYESPSALSSVSAFWTPPTRGPSPSARIGLDCLLYDCEQVRVAEQLRAFRAQPQNVHKSARDPRSFRQRAQPPLEVGK